MTYIVLARIRDKDGRNGPYVRVAGTMSDDWAIVQRRWAFLDEANRKDRVFVVKDDPRWLYVLPASIAYFAVRDLKDPAVAARRGPWDNTWGDIAHDTIHLVVADNKPAMHQGALERRWGKAHGYHGHVGGWIHRGKHPGRGDHASHSCPSTGVQGWGGIIPRKAIGTVLVTGAVRYIIPAEMP